MKVLGIVGSARKLGNSEILAKEILAALPETAEKKLVRLTDLELRQCNACYACLPEDRSCVLQDDFAFLLEQIREADAIVLAAPCYFLGSHTTIKLLSDRLISVLKKSKEFAGKKCVVAVSYGIEGWEGYALEATVNLARFLHLDVVGTMLVKAASPGETVKPEVLQEAHRLAAALIGGKEAWPKDDLLRCKECGSSLLQLSAGGAVSCRMCNAQGALLSGDDGVRIRFNPGKHRRFSPEGMTEHGRLLEDVRDDYIARRQELNRLRKPYQAYDWWIKPEAGCR